MKKLNEGQRFTTDPVDASRTAYMVEESDVGKQQLNYLGYNQTYTFQADDVGRLIEVVRNMSPGSVSWYFGSMFSELRKQYPDAKPYIGAPSAQE